MRRQILLTTTLALAASAAAAPASAEAVRAYVPGQVVVRYAGGTPEAARRAIERDAGARLARRLPGGARLLRVRGDVLAAAARLGRRRAVLEAAPDPVARASFVPNDPGVRGGTPGGWQATQWNFVGPASVNAPEAWDTAIRLGAPGGRGITVAVLDTGVAYRNAGRFRRAPDLYSRRFARGHDFVDGDRYPDDENGHGTHVTGTIAQRTHNRFGLTGLAYGVTIMPLRVLDEEGAGGASAIARALRFAIAHGADVINMSLEFDGSVRAAEIPEVLRALRLGRRRGVVTVAASGNEGFPTVAYPARAEEVIAVGSSTERLCVSEFSNTGPGIDVVAPGGGNDAAEGDNPRDRANCNPLAGGRGVFQNTYTTSIRRFGFPTGYQGTSMASPHVAATVALYLATRRAQGHRAAPIEVEQRLRATARDLGPEGPDTRYGFGLIDTAAAIAP